MPYFKIKNNVKLLKNKEVKKLKPPYVLLSPHPSKPDFVYNAMCVFPKRLNAIVARYYFYNTARKKLLEQLGCIPKSLFCADIETIKGTMEIIKKNGIILMMPEGRLSASGETEKMPGGLGKLIKKLKVPVVVTTINGAHLTGAKWMEKLRKGRIEVGSEIVLTVEDIMNMDDLMIEQKINEKIYYNDYEWNKTAKIEYRGKNLLKGLDNLIYICPNCKEEFSLETDKNIIQCKHCGFNVEMDNTYQFIKKDENYFDNINQWFKFQIEYEKEQIISKGLNMNTKVILKMPKKDSKRPVVVGEGTCYLNEEELRYEGTINKEIVTRIFKIKNIQALPFGCGEDFEIYHNNDFYYFAPIENKKQCVKWSITTEIAHNLTL